MNPSKTVRLPDFENRNNTIHICDVTSLLHFLDHVVHCKGCAKNDYF